MPSGSVDLAGKVTNQAGVDKASLTVSLYTAANWEAAAAATATTTTDSDGLWAFTGKDITQTWIVVVADGDKKVLLDSRNKIQLTNIDVIDDISVDTIYEHTSAAGVTIDGVLLKDSYVDLAEATLPAGTRVYVGRDNSGDMTANVLTGKDFIVAINGVDQAIIDDRGVDIITGNEFLINGTSVLNATTLGSGVTASSLTSVGTLASPVLTTPDINGGTADSLTSLSIRSTGAAFDLTFATATVFTAGRTLTIDPGNAARTITLSGNPTLADWFDQAVKAASSPTFANLTITSFAANWTNAGRTVADLGIVTTVDINGGSIDGTTIGASSTSTGAFTTLSASGATTITGTAGIDYNPGSDADADIVTVGVTGTPRVFWDESEDAFSAAKFEITSLAAVGNSGTIQTTIGLNVNETYTDSAAHSVQEIRLTHTQSTGATANRFNGLMTVLALNGAQDYTKTDGGAQDILSVVDFDMRLGGSGTYTAPVTLRVGFRKFSTGPVTLGETIRISAWGNFNATNAIATLHGLHILNPTATGTITTLNGIIIDTLTSGGTNYAFTIGSTDVDQNLIHVGVTGDPIFSWDESESAFAFNLGVSVGGILKQNVTGASMVVAGGIAFTDVANAWIDDATHGTGTTTHYIGNQTVDTTASDVRLKEQFTPPNGLAREHLSILAAHLEEYNYVRDTLGGQRFVGFGAQHLYDVLPQYVVKGEGENHWSVNYKYMVGPLLWGWQDHEGRLIEHETKFSSLEDRASALEEAVSILRRQVQELGAEPRR